MKNAHEFIPYQRYVQSQRTIDEFETLTDLSYAVTQQLLFRHSSDELKHIRMPSPATDQLSFAACDREVTGVEVAAEWVSAAEYARRTNQTSEVVSELLLAGSLGATETHPETGETLALWPPTAHSTQQSLPKPPMKTFVVKMKVTARAPLELGIGEAESFEQVQHQYLRLAHSLGEPDRVAQNARAMLFRSCLLLSWTAFEVYLRETLQELYRLNPNKLAAAKTSTRAILSAKDVLEMSDSLSSLELLRTRLIDMQIQQQVGDASIHALTGC